MKKETIMFGKKVALWDLGRPEYLDGALAQYHVDVRKKNGSETVGYFSSKEDAKLFARAKERSLAVPKTYRTVRVVLYRDGETAVAHCVDYDIAVQGIDTGESLKRLALTLEAERDMRGNPASDPFRGIDAAPASVQRLWDWDAASLSGATWGGFSFVIQTKGAVKPL